MTSAARWLESITPGAATIPVVVEKLVALAAHTKWEVRRAVANAAARTLHRDFDRVLVALAVDDNARVRQAAETAVLRRRTWSNTSALGKQHEAHLNAVLEDMEARFGSRGRAATKRAAEHIADTFARELYHEVVRLLQPLTTSADRLVQRLGDEGISRDELVDEAARMRQRVAALRSVLDGMRAYAAQHKLEYGTEDMKQVIEESVGIVRDGRSHGPHIEIDVATGLHVEICRPRFVQAMTNLLANAVESYDGLANVAPIAITALTEEERVVIAFKDHGCGMSEEALADATLLFTTSKERGTGFGLPLVVKIIESEHDGRLELESRKGHGTTARVFVPVRRPRVRS